MTLPLAPDSRSLRLVLCGSVLLLLLRTVAQAFVPLMPQEAYYWMYSQHQSLSYYDHPPMVAWVIGLGTAMFGNNEWGVRCVGGVLMLVNGGLMYRFARVWWGPVATLLSVAFIEVTPTYLGLGLLATMDAALLTFWLVTLLGFSAAVRGGRVWGWYVCGFGLGGALLSKYTGVFLVPGVGLALLWHRPWRKYVASPHPYLAVVLGLVIFAPVLAWNWRHDWASFRFQFTDRFDTTPSEYHKHPFFEYLGQQFIVATPLVIGATGLLLWQWGRRRRTPARDKVALAFSMPLLLVMAKKGWTYPVHINWTVPAYLSLLPAAWTLVRVWVRARKARPAWIWRAGVAWPTLGTTAVISGLILAFLLTVQLKTHSIKHFGPWAELARRVETCEDDLEARTGHEPLVIADGKYELASVLAFYRNRIAAQDLPAETTVSQYAIGQDGLGFAYWTDVNRWVGRDCIFVDKELVFDKDLRRKFRSVRVVWQGKMADGQTYAIAECLGYRGPDGAPAVRPRAG